jgi:hypothetical protein
VSLRAAVEERLAAAAQEDPVGALRALTATIKEQK